MEENKEDILKETPLEEEKGISSPTAESAEVPEVKTADTPAAREKKETRRRKKQQAPEAAAAAAAKKDTPEEETSGAKEKKATVPRLKTSLRHGFQLKGRYYSRAELGRRTMLEKLYKQYPGLFEK